MAHISYDTDTHIMWPPSLIARISCRWHTRATRCITPNVLQTKEVDAQFDKLAPELSWQRFASKVGNLQLPHLHLTYPTCISRLYWGCRPFEFCQDFRRQKTRVPLLSCGVIYVMFTFNRFCRSLTCDWQTDRHRATANTHDERLKKVKVVRWVSADCAWREGFM